MPRPGEMMEGKIIRISKTSLIVELGPFGTGIIYGRELKENRRSFRDFDEGDTISALVVDPENDDGYVELSFKEANLEKAWQDLEKAKQENETIIVEIVEANRGGLVVRFYDVVGFLPVSQLSPQNYPRVEGGDKNKILNHLNKFVNSEMKVKIISLDKKNEKLIVSEKATQKEKIQESLDQYKPGDVIEGTVNALADFGAFIQLNEHLEGLAHISELDWQIIGHPNQVLEENQKVKAQIIDIQNGQISLSLKALKENPWQKAESKYQPGQKVKGKVIKFTSLGALVQIEKGLHGLVHSSEAARQNSQSISEILETNQSYNFEILSLSPQEHKMSLALAE